MTTPQQHVLATEWTPSLIAIADIADNRKWNTRQSSDERLQAELNASVKEKGILQAILVRPGKNGSTYELIAGARRLKAAKVNSFTHIPAIIRDATDEEALEINMIENILRQDLHPMEEANSFRDAIALGKYDADSLSTKIGKPISYIAQRLKLLDLAANARKDFSQNVISLDHATLLAKMTPEDQKRALEFLIELDFEYDHRVAKDVKVFKSWIAEEISLNLSAAPFDKSDPNLIAGVVPCTECPKNSGFNTALFPELNAKHICGDRICFKAKVQAHLNREKKKARKEEKRGFIMISVGSLAMDDPLKVDGVKMEGRYKIVKAGKECEDTKRAQWIDGPNKGKFTLVCNYSKCKKHWRGAGRQPSQGGFNDPREKEKREHAERDADFDKAVRKLAQGEIASRLLEKLHGKLDGLAWQGLASVLWDDYFYAIDEALIERLTGLNLNKIEKRIDSMKPAEAERLILSILLASRPDFDEGSFILKAAKHHKLDIQAWVKKVEATLHRCEVCRCSELTACADRCSWAKPFLEAKRHVCSNCVDKAKPIGKATAQPKKKDANSPAGSEKNAKAGNTTK